MLSATEGQQRSVHRHRGDEPVFLVFLVGAIVAVIQGLD